MKKKIINPGRNFGILFFIVFSLYGIWPIFNLNNIRIWSLIIGVIFLVVSLLNPKLLIPLNTIWLKFGELLGKIISPMVMAFIYFLIITPIGIIVKLFGKDLLNTKFNSKFTYWISRKKNVGSMKKQF